MAVTHWESGRATETTATVIVRADVTGDVEVVANGQPVQASCNTAINDGNATATFSGLTAGATYAYTVGGVAGGTLRTAPSGSAPFWIALTSCWGHSLRDPLSAQLLKAPSRAHPLHAEMVAGLKGFFAIGDWIYMNGNSTVNGYPLVLIDGGTLAACKVTDNRRNYYRAQGLSPVATSLCRNVPTYHMKDDHEYDPDNACYDVAWLAGKFGGATQTDLDEVWTAATTAWREWTTGNPTAEVAGCDAYRVRLGPLEVWVTDLIQERTYHGTVDGPTKRLMSAEQEEWLLSTMAASTAPFKLWASTKQFISSCGRNADGWDNVGGAGVGYKQQLIRILTDARFPRAGSFSVTGDEHIKSDIFVAADQLGAGSSAISQMAAGPATIPVITDPNDGLAYRTGVREKERDTSTISGAGYNPRGEQSYTLLRVLPDRIERYRLGSRYGLKYFGYIGTADNLVRR